jgi:hypothetical protein
VELEVEYLLVCDILWQIFAVEVMQVMWIKNLVYNLKACRSNDNSESISRFNIWSGIQWVYFALMQMLCVEIEVLFICWLCQ